jgi:hypothetical protein
METNEKKVLKLGWLHEASRNKMSSSS